MSEKPILFSGAMVRAILAGTKCVTRRVIGLREFAPSTTPGSRFQEACMNQPTSLEEYRARRSPQRPKHLLTLCELPEGGVGLQVGPTVVDLTSDQVEVVAAFLQTYLARRGGER